MARHEAVQTIGPAADTERSEARATSEQAREFNRRGTLTVSGAHFAHDLYSSFLGVLIPAVQEKLGISLALASIMVPAQQMPSILQPYFGFLADRTSRRWFVVGAPAVAGISLSSVGLAPNVYLIILLLLISGLASAAFHAPAIALVGEFGGNKMGRAMSYFMAGGEMSRSLGPLLITGAIAALTLEGSAAVMVVGIAGSIILYFTLDTSASDAARRARPSVNIRPLIRARRRQIGGLFGYSIVNSMATTPFHFFLVKLLVDKGYSEWYAGIALSILFAAGVVGGLLGGSLSDRMGRRRMLFLAAFFTSPLYYLYLALENGSWAVLGMLAIAGVVAMSGRPTTLAVAQELLPEARGPIAGMMLATGFVTMSVSALAFGALGDAIGVEDAFWITTIISLFGVIFITMLPRKGEALAQAEGE